jgi:hypothetical protein
MQKDDLARMYRLFNRVPKGLEPVADMFKKHVENEGMKLVKAVTETATAKKDKEKETGGMCCRGIPGVDPKRDECLLKCTL